MARTEKQIIGKWGEKKSSKYLKKKKYKILDKNYLTKYGELDIVAEKDNYIVFVEVKTRKENSIYPPVMAVNYYKQQRLFKAAFLYLKEYPTTKNIRFDIIEVIHRDKKLVSINHIKNAFSQRGGYGRF